MEQRMKIAGIGGQGVMVTGKILGYAASDHDKFASFLPQYGTQMRGGTSSCTLIIADEEIGSPIVSTADLIAVASQECLLRQPRERAPRPLGNPGAERRKFRPKRSLRHPRPAARAYRVHRQTRRPTCLRLRPETRRRRRQKHRPAPESRPTQLRRP